MAWSVLNWKADDHWYLIFKSQLIIRENYVEINGTKTLF